jgi:hypothetical protein
LSVIESRDNLTRQQWVIGIKHDAPLDSWNGFQRETKRVTGTKWAVLHNDLDVVPANRRGNVFSLLAGNKNRDVGVYGRSGSEHVLNHRQAGERVQGFGKSRLHPLTSAGGKHNQRRLWR